MDSTKRKRKVLIGNSRYGLYIGEIDASDEEVNRDKAVRVVGCRHVFRWYGMAGGITALAAHGPCGPNGGDSRIGAPCDALITDVVNVFDISPEAWAAFESIRHG